MGTAPGRARERAAPTPARSATAGAAQEPGVTDADLLLGYLDPDYFLGGEHDARQRRRPRGGIDEKVAEPLGVTSAPGRPGASTT
ncbi:MAG: hypothetical protein MZW92_70970 [Comamonadaceae bacterium]|nr:hypothetical protein [Comamonadaceae bacterium]